MASIGTITASIRVILAQGERSLQENEERPKSGIVNYIESICLTTDRLINIYHPNEDDYFYDKLIEHKWFSTKNKTQKQCTMMYKHCNSKIANEKGTKILFWKLADANVAVAFAKSLKPKYKIEDDRKKGKNLEQDSNGRLLNCSNFLVAFAKLIFYVYEDYFEKATKNAWKKQKKRDKKLEKLKQIIDSKGLTKIIVIIVPHPSNDLKTESFKMHNITEHGTFDRKHYPPVFARGINAEIAEKYLQQIFGGRMKNNRSYEEGVLADIQQAAIQQSVDAQGGKYRLINNQIQCVIINELDVFEVPQEEPEEEPSTSWYVRILDCILCKQRQKKSIVSDDSSINDWWPALSRID